LETTQTHIAFTKESRASLSSEGASYNSAQKPLSSGLLAVCTCPTRGFFTVRQILILFRLRLLTLPTLSRSSFTSSFTSPPPLLTTFPAILLHLVPTPSSSRLPPSPSFSRLSITSSCISRSVTTSRHNMRAKIPRKWVSKARRV
jgi:hypothetical protein